MAGFIRDNGGGGAGNIGNLEEILNQILDIEFTEEDIQEALSYVVGLEATQK